MSRAIRCSLVLFFFSFLQLELHAQPPAPVADEVPGGTAPLLRLTAKGPLSQISCLELSPNGQTLYAAGWDKVVHVWTRQEQGFVYDRDATYRIPIGGGLDGGINVISISDDGQWLAVGGRGAKRGVAGQRDFGYLIPARSLSPEAWKDEGQIYVFNTTTRECRTLRGHLGSVIALSFAPSREGKGPVLVSVSATSRERQEGGQIFAWDVATSAPINSTERFENSNGELTRLPAINISFPPRPVVSWGGTDDSEIRVALTWGTPGFGLRIWKVQAAAVGPPVAGDSRHYFTLAPENSGSFLSGAGNTQTGKVELGRWSIPTGRQTLNQTQDYSVLQQFASQEFITNIAAGSEQWGPAVILTDMQKQQARLVGLKPNGQQLAGEAPLWKGLFAASLARARDEGTLAVCRAGTAMIFIFRRSDLEQGLAPQQLQLDLPQLEQIAFVNKGEDAGLKITHHGQPAMVFDLVRSRWVPADEDWKENSGNATDAKVTQTSAEAGRLTLEIQRPGQPVSQVLVRSRTSETETPQLISARIFPGNEQIPVPWLLCAIQTNLQPELQVFDLRNGEQIRQLTAHTGLISQLAVSGDGRLAASISEDHKLCLWRMSDLPQELGKHGLIRTANELLEVEVRENGKLMVGNAVAGLQPDLEIRGGLVAQEERPINDGRSFYKFVHARAPGETVTLKTDRGDVNVLVGQAIDDRKPLFSLYVVPADKLADWQWIGWNPLGPYEASHREVEQALGWHFNTGEPNAPARFAAAEGYRDAFETPRLLDHLYRHEVLPPRPPAPPPTMSLLIQNPQGDVLRSDFDGLIPASDLESTLIFQATGKQLSQILSNVEFVLENGAAAPQVLEAQTSGQGEWRAKLGSFQWQRGRNRIVARIVTNEFPSRQFEEALNLRYQPAAPVVELQAPALPVEKAALEFRFRILPSSVPAEVLLRQRNANGGVIVEHRWSEPIPAATSLSHSLMLQPGTNRVEVIASNQHPLYGFESEETTRQTLDVPYQQPAPVDPPKLSQLHLRAGDDPASEFADHGRLELETAGVTLAGHVTCAKPLKALRIKVGEQTLAVENLVGQQGDLKFSRDLQLKPGPQQVAIQVEMEGDLKDEISAQLVYRPQLPFLKNYTVTPELLPGVNQPAGVENSVRNLNGDLNLVDDLHQPWVHLQAEIQAPENDEDYHAVIIVDDQEHPEIPVGFDAGKLSAKVPVRAGSQRIQFRLFNDWQRASNSLEEIVNFRQPPHVEAVSNEPIALTSPQISQVSFVVDAPEALPPLADQLRVELNGSPVPCIAEIVPLKAGQWQVVVHELALDREGENAAKFQIGNAHGFGSQFYEQRWKLEKPPKARPNLAIESLPTQTHERVVQLEFTVQSDSPLQTVMVERLMLGVAQTLASTRAEGGAALAPQRVFGGSATYQLAVRLSPGVNELKVTAVNAGGVGSETRSVSYVPMPIQLTIQQLGEIHPVRKNENLDFGAPIQQSQAELRGFIEWDSEETPPEYAQFWVNGFMQRSVQLQPIPGAVRKKRFEVALNFSRDKKNAVEVSLPGHPTDALSRKQMAFTVDCDQPAIKQDLHLLIIGTLPEQEAPPDYRKILEHRAEEALRARLGPDQRLQSSAFSRIHTTVLTGEKAKFTIINSVILGLKYQLAPQSSRGFAAAQNSVLMIYYHGREKIVQRGNEDIFVLATPETWEDPAAQINKSIRNTYLSNLLATYYGAHVLFLDVESANDDAEVRWPEDPHLGIVRTVWSEGRWSPDSPLLMNAVANTPAKAQSLGDLVSGMENGWPAAKPLLADFKIPLSLQQLELRGIAAE